MGLQAAARMVHAGQAQAVPSAPQPDLGLSLFSRRPVAPLPLLAARPQHTNPGADRLLHVRSGLEGPSNLTLKVQEEHVTVAKASSDSQRASCLHGSCLFFLGHFSEQSFLILPSPAPTCP